ncbi:hypothetical protein Avbf_03428 [Armadillidium vulgare]|nr:hypothetical protein Avbf_03428 [Armadillidium vulgare]
MMMLGDFLLFPSASRLTFLVNCKSLGNIKSFYMVKVHNLIKRFFYDFGVNYFKMIFNFRKCWLEYLEICIFERHYTDIPIKKAGMTHDGLPNTVEVFLLDLYSYKNYTAHFSNCPHSMVG